MLGDFSDKNITHYPLCLFCVYRFLRLIIAVMTALAMQSAIPEAASNGHFAIFTGAGASGISVSSEEIGASEVLGTSVITSSAFTVWTVVNPTVLSQREGG